MHPAAPNNVRSRKLFLKKAHAIIKKGGKCAECGYDKNLAALDFAHIPDLGKEGNLSQLFRRSEKAWKAELDKCRVLCANCHREETHPLLTTNLSWSPLTYLSF